MDADGVVAVGDEGTILHYAGGVWSSHNTSSMMHLYAVWGGDGIRIAVGAAGDAWRFDGTVWSHFDSAASQELVAVWGTNANDVVAVGRNGEIVHFFGMIASGTET
jgi:hypothetical protein